MEPSSQVRKVGFLYFTNKVKFNELPVLLNKSKSSCSKLMANLLTDKKFNLKNANDVIINNKQKPYLLPEVAKPVIEIEYNKCFSENENDYGYYFNHWMNSNERIALTNYKNYYGEE